MSTPSTIPEIDFRDVDFPCTRRYLRKRALMDLGFSALIAFVILAIFAVDAWGRS